MTATRFVELIPALLTLLLLTHVKVAAQEKDSDYQWQENILDDAHPSVFMGDFVD